MRSSTTFVVSEGMFGVFYVGQEEFEGNNKFDIILVLKLLAAIPCLMVAGYDGLIEFSIGEIVEVSITTQEHIAKYGTYGSRGGENIEFNKCDISRMITVDALTIDGVSSH